jgi:sulfur relay (sulfurtransferase) DsrC/TusE family protein
MIDENFRYYLQIKHRNFLEYVRKFYAGYTTSSSANLAIRILTDGYYSKSDVPFLNEIRKEFVELYYDEITGLNDYG